MKRIFLLIGLSGLMLTPAAFAQSLSERINHARQQQGRSDDLKVDKTSVRYMLGKLLYTDITIELEDTPARDVIKYIGGMIDVNIIGRYSDDRNSLGLGIDPDTLINLDVEDASALTVLELILEQVADLEPATWQMRRGYIEVGTLERLSTAAARVVKVYPIDDLLFEAPNFTNAPSLDLRDAYRNTYDPYGRGYGGGAGGSFSTSGSYGRQSSNSSKEAKANELIDLIIMQIEPTAWETNGGNFASIRYVDKALIVNAPDYIHRQIGGYPKPQKPKPVAVESEAKDNPEDGKP